MPLSFLMYVAKEVWQEESKQEGRKEERKELAKSISMDTNMKAALCVKTLNNAITAYPMLKGAVIHSDRGSQYTSEEYRRELYRFNIVQSMNSDSGRCHDNARCESMWARMKTELLYDRYNTEKMTAEELKSLIWRYFMSYWNNRRICSANNFEKNVPTNIDNITFRCIGH